MTLKRLDIRQKPDLDVVKTVEELLEMAKSGELRALACAVVLDCPGSPDSTALFRAGVAAMAPMVLALERAKLRLIGFVEDIDIK